MNRFYTLIFCLFSTVLTFGQVVHLDSEPLVSQNGQTIDLVIDYDYYSVYMHCLNTSGATVNWKFRRVIINESVAFNDQFCDDNLCYNCSGSDWTSGQMTTVVAGDSTIMKPIFTFSAGGTALIRYYILDADNGDAILDSVDLNITSLMGVAELQTKINAFPNPVSETFYIEIQNGNKGNNEVLFYNLIGEKVKSVSLSEGLNSISTESMNNGVYFYTIMKNNKAIETKKLVVRK